MTMTVILSFHRWCFFVASSQGVLVIVVRSKSVEELNLFPPMGSTPLTSEALVVQ
jgi:hypothetical protein